MHLILSLHRDWQYLQSLVIWLQSSEVMAIAGSTFSCHNNQSKCGLRFCYHVAKILKPSDSMIDSQVFQAAQNSCRWVSIDSQDHFLRVLMRFHASKFQRPVATWLIHKVQMSSKASLAIARPWTGPKYVNRQGGDRTFHATFLMPSATSP